MKGLVTRHDPPGTKEGMQVTRSAAPSQLMADQGIGVVVPRHDPEVALALPSAQFVTGRPALSIPKFGARQLDPVSDEDFDGIGKPPLYASSHRQVWTSFNIPSILSYDGYPPDDGYFAKWLRSNIIRTPRGFQTAMVNPITIAVPDSQPAGSQQTLPGVSAVSLADLYV